MRVPVTTATARTPSSWKKIYRSKGKGGKRREAPVILFEGKEISVLREGQGEDLVFLHGYLSCKESFTYQLKYFAKYYRVTAFDFVGFGKSAPLTEPWSVGDYAAHAARLLSALGIKRGARLIAHSFGGRVALKLLSGRQELFRKALLAGCAGIPPKRGLSYKCKVRAYRIAKKFAPRFAEKKFGSPEYRTLSPVMRESYKKIVNEDLSPCLPKISAEVLYVFGEKDAETPLYMAKKLTEGTRGSALVVMPACGHFCFTDDPARFNAVAREFFR